MSSSEEDKPKAKRPKRKSSRKKSKKEKRQGKQENECEYSESDIIDETETGADILKLLLHPCKLPFEVQNKLLFYLDDDEINILAKDRIKSKEGYEAGPTFNFHDHAYEPIKNLLRVQPGQNAQSNINKIYDKAEKAYLVKIGKAGDSTDSNTYIKDDRGLIHKFKLNMKTCVGHTMAMKDKENEQIPEFPLFECNQESENEMEETEETRPVCNKPVRKGGGSGKILGAIRKQSRADTNMMEKSVASGGNTS